MKFPVEYVEEEEEEEEAELMEEEYDGSKVVILTPRDNAYWQEGVGPGGEKPWKFRCSCGQECSSYENYRYHAVGRMFECTECSKWAHVDCVWGAKISDEDIEEMEV